MIPPKLFQKLMDLYARTQTTRSEALSADRDYIAFADQTGWPWNASQEQLVYWNTVQNR